MNEVKESIESCSSNSTNVIRKTKRVPSLCEICGASALYKYFGVLSCQSCKIFFKRNALLGMEKLKCHFDGNCEIDIFNRHTCSYCRLKKCFDCGMREYMIRRSIRIKKQTNNTNIN